MSVHTVGDAITGGSTGGTGSYVEKVPTEPARQGYEWTYDPTTGTWYERRSSQPLPDFPTEPPPDGYEWVFSGATNSFVPRPVPDQLPGNLEGLAAKLISEDNWTEATRVLGAWRELDDGAKLEYAMRIASMPGDYVTLWAMARGGQYALPWMPGVRRIPFAEMIANEAGDAGIFSDYSGEPPEINPVPPDDLAPPDDPGAPSIIVDDGTETDTTEKDDLEDPEPVNKLSPEWWAWAIRHGVRTQAQWDEFLRVLAEQEALDFNLPGGGEFNPDPAPPWWEAGAGGQGSDYDRVPTPNFPLNPTAPAYAQEEVGDYYPVQPDITGGQPELLPSQFLNAPVRPPGGITGPGGPEDAGRVNQVSGITDPSLYADPLEHMGATSGADDADNDDEIELALNQLQNPTSTGSKADDFMGQGSSVPTITKVPGSGYDSKGQVSYKRVGDTWVEGTIVDGTFKPTGNTNPVQKDYDANMRARGYDSTKWRTTV